MEGGPLRKLMKWELVDDIRDTAEIAYTGWPDRLCVINRAGHVGYKAHPGPYGFIPNEVEKTLRQPTPSSGPRLAAERNVPSMNSGHTLFLT